MAIVAGQTAAAADVKAIKDDVDAIVSAAKSTVTPGESTSSTTYTDLATTGPAVTITTGSKALVCITAEVAPDTSASGRNARMSYAVSGASTVSAADGNAILVRSGGTSDEARISVWSLQTGLTAGSNTFTAKYRVNAGTGTFTRRDILVIPLGD